MRSITADRSWVTNVLMITTTMGMLYGVHSHTSDSRPVQLLGLLLVVTGTSLQERLVGPAATGADANHCSAAAGNGFPLSRRKSDSAFLSILGVANDDSIGSGGPRESTTVTLLCLTVGNNCTFGHGLNWENVANSKRCY